MKRQDAAVWLVVLSEFGGKGLCYMSVVVYASFLAVLWRRNQMPPLLPVNLKFESLVFLALLRVNHQKSTT